MSDAELAGALAVPEELQQLKTLELLDYVTARFLTENSRFESRDAWAALRSAADTAADHSFALHTPAGEEARTWIDYVGLGLGIEVQAGERPVSAAWIQAFHLALIVRNERTLLKLYQTVHLLPEGSEASYARALGARWASTHGFTGQGTVSAEPTDGRTALLHALVRNDHSDFNERLGAALEQYRLLAGRFVRDRIAWGPLALAALAHDSGVTIVAESGYLPARLVTGYFSVGDRSGDMDGLIAIEALGLACAAHDRGWTIEVESDYLPPQIVDGSWTRTPPDFTRFG